VSITTRELSKKGLQADIPHFSFPTMPS